jgi:hypothetical protein
MSSTDTRPSRGTSWMFFVLIWAPMIWWLVGCGPVSPETRQVINVLCKGDAIAQPIVVPIIIFASPLAGPVAPVISGVGGLDQAVFHPLIVKACADYNEKPAAIVASAPAGAKVAEAVTLTP